MKRLGPPVTPEELQAELSAFILMYNNIFIRTYETYRTNQGSLWIIDNNETDYITTSTFIITLSMCTR